MGTCLRKFIFGFIISSHSPGVAASLVSQSAWCVQIASRACSHPLSLLPLNSPPHKKNISGITHPTAAPPGAGIERVHRNCKCVCHGVGTARRADLRRHHAYGARERHHVHKCSSKFAGEFHHGTTKRCKQQPRCFRLSA